MISLELDMELPSMCAECPLRKTKDGRFYCSASGVAITDECVYGKRPFWCKLKDNRELNGIYNFKTQLCDGRVHITAKDYIEHSVKVNHEKQRMKLKKLANNPALSDDARDILYKQIYNINLLEWWREWYIEMRDKYEELVKKNKPREWYYTKRK